MPIFISYSSKDRKSAEAICTAIENRGFQCWISSRDIGPGENFQTQIVRAIRNAKVMVLVFSSNANNSEEIKKELVLAGQSRLVVIPVRVEDVTPDEAFAYEFATRQWIDVFGDWENAIHRVIQQIEGVVGEAPAKPPAAAASEAVKAEAPAAHPVSPATAASAPPAAAAPAARQVSLAAMLGGAAVLIVVLAGVLAWQMWPKPAPAPGPIAASHPAPQPKPTTPIAIPPATSAPAWQAAFATQLQNALPTMPEAARADILRGYEGAAGHKAQAISLDTASAWRSAGRSSAEDAEAAALEQCQVARDAPCALLAVDEDVKTPGADGKWVARNMPRAAYAGEFSPSQIPGLRPEIRDRADIVGYSAAPTPKAIAYQANNSRLFIVTAAASQHAAEEQALKECSEEATRDRLATPCFLYAVGARVVLPQRLTAPLTPEPATAAAPAPAPQPSVASHAPPKTFRDCPNCPEMVVIPAGSFQMGAAPGENERFNVPTTEAGRTEPQHQVTFAHPFALAKFDITRGEFAAFAAQTHFRPRPGCLSNINGSWRPQPNASWEDPGFPQSDRDPVVCINEIESAAYLEWLSRITGKAYRLPSEAEWEYAARGGTTTAFYWGDDPKEACAYENVGDEDWKQRYNEPRSMPCRDGFADLAPVGSFKPNPFGLYDMVGNIFVLTADCWNESYAGAPSDGSAWTTGDCSRHAARKAAWGNPNPWMFRSANRLAEGSIVKRNRFGFRVALSLP